MNYPKRKNIRLEGHDYRENGGYYLTICTDQKRCILSSISKGNGTERAVTALTSLGQIVQQTIEETATKYEVIIDSYVIMPNHIHMIIILDEQSRISVGRFVGVIKSVTANRWGKVCESDGIRTGKIWQRNYYDHILRNESDYREKRRYVEDNPDRWNADDLFVASQ